jgi:hypothetical protein
MRELKQHNVVKEKELGGNTFYIRPFPAFTAANISGELGGIVAPVVAGALPFLGDGGDAVNLDASAFGSAMSALSGDKVESLLKKLLIKHGNISVKPAGEAEAVTLDSDLANELFCGSAQDMFVLAFEVIQANFSGFFENIASRFGLRKVTAPTQGTQSATSGD